MFSNGVRNAQLPTLLSGLPTTTDFIVGLAACECNSKTVNVVRYFNISLST